MPRPRKCRRICSLPQSEGFVPIRNRFSCEEVILSIDEYEVVRLIDFERLTQEECAAQMTVSRTTITSIYDTARYKIADAMIHSKKLIIDGGEFRLCEHTGKCCGKGCQHKCFNEENENCAKENCLKHKQV